MTAATTRVAGARAVYAAGSFAYLCAVTQRSTLSVAAVPAADRFTATAAAISTLGVLQLIVYAALQIPAGVLLDRFGAKKPLVVGGILMVAGQVLVATTTVLPVAVAGRVLVGAGDATTFVAAVRLIGAWFDSRGIATRVQWLGNIGQVGQVLSLVPFAALLHLDGWTTAFLTAAGLGGVGVVIAIAVVKNAPAGTPATQHEDLRSGVMAFAGAARRPGTHVGFWSHFVTQSSGTVFALFWGYPFLVQGEGIAPAVASTLLLVQVAAGMVAGPVLGVLTARHPMRRTNLVLGIVVLLALTWTLVLAWPGSVPIPVLVLLECALGAGGPASMIGFDIARTFNPAHAQGGATGLVNVGGFTASFVMMFAIGALLDLHTAVFPGAMPFSADAFRFAFLVQVPVIGFGVVMLFRARRRARAAMAPLDPVWVAMVRATRRRRLR